MKILQIIDSLNVGGAEVLAVNIANGLSEKGVDSFLCATRKEGDLKVNINEKVNYIFLNKKKSIDILAVFRLKKYIKKHEIQIIHAHTTSSFIAFCVKLIHPNIKLIWHNHTGAYINLSGKKLRILKWYSRYIDYIISVNKELDSWSKLVLNHKNGAYISNFPVFSNQHKKTKLKGIKDKKIVCLAGLREVKDHINLLKAFVVVRNNFPEWTLHLIGKDYEDICSENIKLFIKEQDLETHVFLYGVQSDIKYILSQASLGVLSSKNEGLPISLLEYGLANLPILVTNVGECKNVINNANAIVESEDSIKFAKALMYIIESKEIKEQIRQSLNETVQQKFSKEAIIKELIYTYTKIC